MRQGVSRALALGTLCAGCHAVTAAELEHAPRPGDAKLETEWLEHRYQYNWSGPCQRSAEEVVDLQRVCNGEHWAECVYAGTMYWQGCGVAQSASRAQEFYGRGCAAGSVLGCTLQGSVTRDRAQAVRLLEEPCHRGYEYACWNLGVALALVGKEADMPRALELLGTACRNDLSYCVTLGQTVSKWRVESKFYDARSLLERACAAKERAACHGLAASYADGSLGVSDVSRAFELEAANCGEHNYGPSCDALGHMYRLGQGCDKNELTGARLFYTACRDGYGPACDSMGQATEHGWGGPASPEQAVGFYERACDAGVEHGCQRSRELQTQR